MKAMFDNREIFLDFPFDGFLLEILDGMESIQKKSETIIIIVHSNYESNEKKNV